jgi:hypothetical protein
LFPQERSSKVFVEAQRISTEIERNRGPIVEMPLATPSK